MYKKILVPLDGSEYSECILGHVIEVAVGCHVPEVILMRVIEPFDHQFHDIPKEWLRNIEKNAKASAEEYLSRLVEKLKQEGIAVETVVGEGTPAEEILAYASKNDVDLIAMSTHGASGISRFAFGSVADKVIRHSSIPLLIASPRGCRVG